MNHIAFNVHWQHIYAIHFNFLISGIIYVLEKIKCYSYHIGGMDSVTLPSNPNTILFHFKLFLFGKLYNYT
jgi:hypothetical protein